MDIKICTFTGHADIFQEEKKLIKSNLKNQILKLIKNENVDTFYCGGKGAFDKLCSGCIKEIKNNYSFVKSYLILSYMPGEKSKSDLDPYNEYDETIYPDLEYVHKRFAIVKRNEWMIKNSNFLIAYVKHDWGGAYRTLKYARRKKDIKIIQL